jgi:iron complex outermembrane recepter protein
MHRLKGFLVLPLIVIAGTSLAATQLEQVVVTAKRVQTNLQETPTAVTTLSSEDLVERNVVDLADLPQFTPGLVIGSRAGTGASDGAIAIRGIGIDSQDSSGSVGVYVDDIYFAGRQGNILGFLDPERVEVLRGPQGTLFGRNTLAGAIQYVTAAPGNEFGGYLTGTFGENDRRQLEAAADIPVSDSFALRIAGLHNERGDYIKGLTGTRHGEQETTAFRIRASITPNDALTIDLKAEHLEAERGPRPVRVVALEENAQFYVLAGAFGADLSMAPSYISSDEDTIAGFNAPDWFEFEFQSFQANIAYDINDNLTIKSFSAHQTYEPRQAVDFDSTPAQVLTIADTHDDTESFSQELQLVGTGWGDSVEYTLGIYYLDSERERNPNRALGLGPLPATPNIGLKDTTESLSAYGRVGIDLTDSLTLDLGIRWTEEDVEAELIDIQTTVSDTFNDTSPHIGLNFQANNDVFLYAKASKGFRAGGFTASALLPGGGVSFDPEEVWTYEIGARIEFPDHGLRINPTVYLSDWNNIQFNTITPTPAQPVVTTANAGDAQLAGIELEALWQATDRLQFMLAMAYTDTEYTDVADLFYATYPDGWAFDPAIAPVPFPLSVVPQRSITKDTPLQRAPELTYTIGVVYDHPLSNGGNVVSNLSYAWVDNQASNVIINSQVELPSYGLLNGRIQYTAPDQGWSVAVYGTNLTDEDYLLGSTSFDRGYTVGFRTEDVARPREIGMELNFNF